MTKNQIINRKSETNKKEPHKLDNQFHNDNLSIE